MCAAASLARRAAHGVRLSERGWFGVAEDVGECCVLCVVHDCVNQCVYIHIVGSWNDPCLALSPSLQRRNAYEPDTPSAIAARAYEFFVNLLFFPFFRYLFIKT